MGGCALFMLGYHLSVLSSLLLSLHRCKRVEHGKMWSFEFRKAVQKCPKC